jgi:hypothetical protein
MNCIIKYLSMCPVYVPVTLLTDCGSMFSKSPAEFELSINKVLQ